LAHFFGKGNEVAGFAVEDVEVDVLEGVVLEGVEADALEDVVVEGVVAVVLEDVEADVLAEVVVVGVAVEEVVPLGDISSSASSSACVVALIALSSPISQPWLYTPCTGL
jgi:hypothetical protein